MFSHAVYTICTAALINNRCNVQNVILLLGLSAVVTGRYCLVTNMLEKIFQPFRGRGLQESMRISVFSYSPLVHEQQA